MDGIKNLVEQILTPFYMAEIERKDMPQVKGKDISEIIDILKKRGIGVEEGSIRCFEIKPTQEDFIPEKLEKMVTNIKSGEFKPEPIFVSRDGYILDGHHRWLALKKVYGEEYKMPVIKVGLPKWEALYVFSDEADQKVDIDKLKEDINPALQNLASVLGAEIVNDDYDVRLKDLTEIHGNKIIVVYPGRFQPFHKGHYSVYQRLIKKFGKDNVYVATSNKVNPDKSPFNFAEKKMIMTKLFDIPANKIVQVSSPYLNTEYKSLGDMDKDSLVMAVSEKDGKRLSNGKYYEKFQSKKLPFGQKGYVFVVPELKGVSGTDIRSLFRSDVSDSVKQALFVKLYGTFTPKLYDLISKKLTEDIILPDDLIQEYLVQTNIKPLLQETTQAVDASVDDGPATFYKNPTHYHSDAEDIIGNLGWQIIDYLAGNKEEYADQRYKYDHVSDVSFGDVGVRDTTYPDPIAKYKLHMEHIAARLGYSIIDWLMTGNKKEDMIDDPLHTMAKYEPLQQKTDDTEPLSKVVKEHIKRLTEGGFASPKVQGTVITPAVVQKVIPLVKKFVGEINKIAKKDGMPPMEFVDAVGSTKHWKKDLKSNPDREYGDIDLVFAYPVWATEGNIRQNQNESIMYYSDILVSLAGKLPYVDSDTAQGKGRNAIMKIGPKEYVQVDFIKTTTELKNWTKGRYAPEYGMKGFAVGNLFAALGDILRLSTGDRGIVAKLKQGEIVSFNLQKDVDVVQVSSDFKNFFTDILNFLTDYMKVKDVKIHPDMQKHKGLNPNDVKLKNMAMGLAGFAKTLELNGMFDGKTIPAKNAKEFMNQVYRNYQLKMASEYTRKVKKAQTEKQKEAIDKIKKSVQDGLKIVKNYLK